MGGSNIIVVGWVRLTRATSLLLVEEEEVLAALTASRQDVCKLVKDVRKRRAAAVEMNQDV